MIALHVSIDRSLCSMQALPVSDNSVSPWLGLHSRLSLLVDLLYSLCSCSSGTATQSDTMMLRCHSTTIISCTSHLVPVCRNLISSCPAAQV